MTSRFVLTKNAVHDLDEILEFVLLNGGPDAALRVHQRFSDEFSKLADEPGIGHTRDDVSELGLRVWRVFSYLVIYLPDTKPLEIIRVIHGMRDLPNVTPQS